MPTYEYQCRDCGGQFEYFQSMSEPPKEKCETCGGSLTKLLSGGSGLIFKGSGFYITDYKSGGSGKPESGGGESKSGGESGGGGEKASTPAPAPKTEKSSS